MIDSHVHLTHERYDEDRDEVIQTAKDKGVTQVILIGCDEQSIDDVINLKQQEPDFMNLAIGWHPVDVGDYTDTTLQSIEQKIIENDIVAIGEIGLDYYWHPEEKELQKDIFKKQIELAKKYDLPIIIHCREAYEDCYEILKQYSPLKGIMHSYAYTPEYCLNIIDLGLEVGFSGPITFKNGQVQKEAAMICPLDKIHLETDGPFLTPVPFRGKRNRPEYIEYIAEEIALQKKISKDKVIEQCTKNTKRLFKLGEK